VEQQREAFAALLENLGQASSAETKRVLNEREEVAPEPGLDPEVVACLRQRTANFGVGVNDRGVATGSTTEEANRPQ
jgi:hypothetical protein